MKRELTVFIFTLFCLSAFSQSVDSHISTAKSAYMKEDFEGARMSLQNALIEIEKAIATEVLAVLPLSMDGMKANTDQDGTTGTGSLMGLYLTRSYGNPEAKHAEIVIADNSPMMGMVSAFLSNPLLAGVAGMASGQKVIRIDGYKGMLQIEEGEIPVYRYMIAFGDTLLTFETNAESEATATAMANQISVSKIAAIVD